MAGAEDAPVGTPKGDCTDTRWCTHRAAPEHRAPVYNNHLDATSKGRVTPHDVAGGSHSATGATGATLFRHNQDVGNGTRRVADDHRKKLHSGVERRLGELNKLRQKCGRNEDLELQRQKRVHAQGQ